MEKIQNNKKKKVYLQKKYNQELTIEKNKKVEKNGEIIEKE